MEERIKELEEKLENHVLYTDELAQKIESLVSYVEKTNGDMESVISYSEYLAEHMDKIITFVDVDGTYRELDTSEIRQTMSRFSTNNRLDPEGTLRF